MPNHASGQPLPEWVRWDCCDQVYADGTRAPGLRSSRYGRCLVHLDATQLASVMTRLDEAAPDLDARGARLTSDDLERLLTAARAEGSSPHLGRVSLDWATIQGDVSLRTKLKGGLYLYNATVTGHLHLDGATVTGDVYLNEATVSGEPEVDESIPAVVFPSATVEGQALLGPISTTALSLAGTEFIRLVYLDMTGKHVEMFRARFLAGLTARVDKAEVAMERVEVRGPAILACATAGSVAPSPPRLLQLAGTDVASLTLAGVDLSACCFSGALNLDKLRIDGSPQLAVRQGCQAHRRVLAEEHAWRHTHAGWRQDSWYPEECRPRPDRVDEPSQILKAEELVGRTGRTRARAQEIAAVYRALRKGREDSKDEPGAADFYYGEMEMRRKAAGGSVEPA